MQMMKEIKLRNKKRKTEAIDVKGVGAGETVVGRSGGASIYLHEEVSVLARTFNHMLKHETALSDRLPMDDKNEDLFNTCSDGLVLIYLLRLIDPTLIDMNHVCFGDNLNVFKVR